ncbi:hypothetical protein HDV00_002035 [Rhizophlyctis rosea]|nr:hypothetical protein HDV00_002035 [Rhizophlyctis rosea]
MTEVSLNEVQERTGSPEPFTILEKPQITDADTTRGVPNENIKEVKKDNAQHYTHAIGDAHANGVERITEVTYNVQEEHQGLTKIANILETLSKTDLIRIIEDTNEKSAAKIANALTEMQISITDSIKKSNEDCTTKITNVLDEIKQCTTTSVAAFTETGTESASKIAKILEQQKDTLTNIVSAIQNSSDKSTAKILTALEDIKKSTTQNVKSLEHSNQLSTKVLTPLHTTNDLTKKKHRTQTLQWAITNASLLHLPYYRVNKSQRGPGFEYTYHHITGDAAIEDLKDTLLRLLGHGTCSMPLRTLKDVGRFASKADMERDIRAYIEKEAEYIQRLTGEKLRINEEKDERIRIWYD